MKAAELLSIGCKIIELMHENGIKTGDYRYLPLYNEYNEMRMKNLKITYIVRVLSERYGICDRKVYKVVRMMERNCQIRAVR